MADTTIHVTLTVKGDARIAESEVCQRLANWLMEDNCPERALAPYPDGSLLHYSTRVVHTWPKAAA